MSQKFVLYDIRVPHFDVQLIWGIELDFVITWFCLCDDVMSDARDIGIGALLVEPVSTQFEAVCVVDWASVRRNFARQVSMNYLVDKLAS